MASSQPSADSLNDITNSLLLKYDQNFQQMYNTSGILDKGIMNKEELITQNINAANNKDKTINILITTVFLVIIYAVLFIANASGKIDSKKLMLISIFIFLIYLFFIYYYFIREPTNKLSKLSAAVGAEIRSAVGTLVGERYNYQCPSGCPPEEEENYYGVIQNYPVPVLNRQSSENVWLNGDRSMNLYNITPPAGNITYSEEELEKIVPQPFFRGINANGATYYDCKFKIPSVSPNFNGIPMKGTNKDMNNIFTTIPCNEMSGYIENGKYICSSRGKDTNSFSGPNDSNCTKVE